MAAKKGANAQTGAASDSIAFQRESRDQALALQAPYRQASYAATAALMDMTGLSRGTPSGRTIDLAQNPSTGVFETPNLADYPTYDFKTDPGYAFRLAEGDKAVQNSLAAKGGVLSGAATKSALRYAENYASQEYQNVYNRIAGIAGFGQTATNASTNIIQQTGANVGTALTNAGDARASSYIAQGNAWSNAINQAAMGYAMYGNSGNNGGSGVYGMNYTPKYGGLS
jgi:hypothetical protein